MQASFSLRLKLAKYASDVLIVVVRCSPTGSVAVIVHAELTYFVWTYAAQDDHPLEVVEARVPHLRKVGLVRSDVVVESTPFGEIVAEMRSDGKQMIAKLRM